MELIGDLVLWSAYLISLYFAIFWFLIFLDKRPLFKEENNRSLKLDRFPYVTVIIPAYNEETTVVPTIQSVLDLDYPKNKLDVIVVNDGSKDRTKEVVEEFIRDKPTVRLLSHKNRGKGASLNRGIRAAKGEFFACLDADSFVDKHTLKKMLSLYYYKGDSNVAIITPAMKVNKPKKIIHKLQSAEYIVSMFVARLMSHLDCIYVAPGPFSLYRTDIIKKLGYFDEHNLTEDQEIAYRVQRAQYKIIQCYDGYVYTWAPSTFKEFYKQRNRWYKGGLSNLVQYRSLIANQRYGDFGLNQTMKNMFGFVLCCTAIIFAFYYVIWPIVLRIYHLSIVDFDIWPYLANLKFTFNILDYDIGKGFILKILFLITLVFFYSSFKNANESIRGHGFIYLIPYFLIFYMVKSVIAVIAIVESMLGKKQKW